MICSALLLLPLPLGASSGLVQEDIALQQGPGTAATQEGGRLVVRGDARVDLGEHLLGDVVCHTFTLEVEGTDRLRVLDLTPT